MWTVGASASAVVDMGRRLLGVPTGTLSFVSWWEKNLCNAPRRGQ
jgi:hypothetical protein